MIKHLLHTRMLLAPEVDSGSGGGGSPAPTKPANPVHGIWGIKDVPKAKTFTEDDIKSSKQPDKTGKKPANKEPDDADDKGGALDPDSDLFDDGIPKTKEEKDKSKRPDNKELDSDDDDDPGDDEDGDDGEGEDDESDLDLDEGDDDPEAPLSERKVSGKGAKTMRQQIEKLSAESKRILAENAAMKKRLEKYESVASEDSLDDSEPERVDLSQDKVFLGHKTSIVKRCNNAVVTTGNEKASEWADTELSSTMESLYSQMNAATTTSAKAKVVSALKAKLAREFKDDANDDDNDDGVAAASRIVDALVDSLPDLEGMYNRRDEVNQPGAKKDKSTLYGVRKASAEELVAGAGENYPEVITAKGGVEAYLSKLSANPKYKIRLESARKTVASFLAGPPELSKEDADKIKATKGEKGVTDARAALHKEWKATRGSLATRLVEALVFFPQVAPLLKELETLREKTTDEDDERHVLSEGRSEPPSKRKTGKSNLSPQKRLLLDLYGRV